MLTLGVKVPLYVFKSFFGGHCYPCSGFLVMSALGFKARVDPLACMLHCLCTMDSSDSSATPTDLLAASMAAKPFWSMYWPSYQERHLWLGKTYEYCIVSKFEQPWQSHFTFTSFLTPWKIAFEEFNLKTRSWHLTFETGPFSIEMVRLQSYLANEETRKTPSRKPF